MNGLILESSPKGKDIKFIGKKDVDTASNETKEIFENIISNMIKEDKDSKNGNFLLAKLLNIQTEFEKNGKNISDFSKDEILNQLSDTKSNKKPDDSSDLALLEELFQAALNIKEGTMPDLKDISSTKLKDALSQKSVVNQLRDAKSIKDLLKIAQDNGIKVKNFEFFKEERALDPQDKKLVHKVTSSDLFKMVEPKTHTNYQKSTKNLIQSLINKEQNSKTIDEKTILSSSYTSKEIKQEKKTTNSNTKEIKQHKAAQNHDLDIDFDLKTNQKEGTDKELIKNSQNNSTHTSIKTKIEKQTTNELQTIFEKSGQKQRVDPQENRGENEKNIDQDKQSDIQSDKTTQTKHETHIKTKESTDIKKSLNTFATEFKERVESYKAPLMKVKMQLSPQNLGEVDVTLINRGNTLHVNITSNSQSMALFMQNQAEFRNSLVNMGFSDLQMSFSQNGEGKNQQNSKNGKKSEDSSYEEGLQNEENNPSIDLIIPNYV